MVRRESFDEEECHRKVMHTIPSKEYLAMLVDDRSAFGKCLVLERDGVRRTYRRVGYLDVA